MHAKWRLLCSDHANETLITDGIFRHLHYRRMSSCPTAHGNNQKDLIYYDLILLPLYTLIMNRVQVGGGGGVL